MKSIRYLFRFLLLIIIILVTFQFIINTKFSFPEPRVFNGVKLYNPYLGIDSTKWKRANFHLHTRLLFGLTAGASITNQIADNFYKFFNYDIHSTSDYMRINTFNCNNKSFVPVYEHGYSYYKTHQLVLNAKKVFWGDYLFHQTLNNKQFIINELKKDTAALVTLVHPLRRNAFSTSDFKYLGNYDCLEIINNEENFTKYLDAALSAGHAVFIMADDDAHNLSDINSGAHSFNIINADLEKNSIIHALRTGRAYGVSLNMNACRTSEEKKEAIEELPVLTKFEIKHDTLIVKMNKNVSAIKFIGQNGTPKKKSVNCSSGIYLFSNEDTYIRTEIVCNDGAVCFLNPVFRYDGYKLPVNNPGINILKTWTYRILFSVILFIIIFVDVKYKACIKGKKLL
ncbi:MAG: hypothetical protein ABSA76_04040 [Bacteroidales bacterium]